MPSAYSVFVKVFEKDPYAGRRCSRLGANTSIARQQEKNSSPLAKTLSSRVSPRAASLGRLTAKECSLVGRKASGVHCALDGRVAEEFLLHFDIGAR
jgi:hypothetical protein